VKKNSLFKITENNKDGDLVKKGRKGEKGAKGILLFGNQSPQEGGGTLPRGGGGGNCASQGKENLLLRPGDLRIWDGGREIRGSNYPITEKKKKGRALFTT